MNLALFQLLVAQPEGAHLEVKEWKHRCDLDELCRYCCALANEGGGHLLIGVSDRRPRKVVGTRVFPSLEAAAASVRERVGIDVEAAALEVNSKRVVVLSVPSRPRGAPVLFGGVGYHREGESLVVMPYGVLRAILGERGDGEAPGGGLDWGAIEGQLLERLKAHGAAGASLAELRRGLPRVRRDYVRGMLGELCDEGKARVEGEDRGARWYARG